MSALETLEREVARRALLTTMKQMPRRPLEKLGSWDSWAWLSGEPVLWQVWLRLLPPPNAWLDTHAVPYDKVTSQYDSYMAQTMARVPLARGFSWAIPTTKVLLKIAALGPIVEIGAGTGYWAAWLAECGATVHAYDRATTARYNGYGHEATFYGVQRGGAASVRAHPHATLFLCWPPYDEPMAARALHLYKGDKVVFIGESDWGCTGDREFHEALHKKWHLVDEMRIPQWEGIHDRLWIYERA